MRNLAPVLLILTLTACAGESNPIALEPVDSGSTLYQAVIAQGVPAVVAQTGFAKYDQFKNQIRRTDFIALVDFSQHSSSRRFYFVDRRSGLVEQWAVAHGEGSDPDNDGAAQYFSNLPDSRMSSLGAYLIQEKYVGKYGESMRLDGLESSNSNVRDRSIVLHPSNYVEDGKAKQGRSWGCPAIPYAKIQALIPRAQDGTFMYVYGVNRRSTAQDFGLLQQWNMIPKALWPNEGDGAL